MYVLIRCLSYLNFHSSLNSLAQCGGGAHLLLTASPAGSAVCTGHSSRSATQPLSLAAADASVLPTVMQYVRTAQCVLSAVATGAAGHCAQACCQLLLPA